MSSRVKVRNKETGKREILYEVVERDGFKEIDGKKYNKFKRTIFKDSELKEEVNKDMYDIIPWEPFELFGIECGEGWHSLLKPVIDYITEYNKDKTEEEKIEICQIKEKWGGLEIYLSHYNDEVNELIKKAREEARNTCELCGSKKDVGMVYESWIRTECHDCLKDWCKKHELPRRWKRNSDGKIYWVSPNEEDELFEGKEL